MCSSQIWHMHTSIIRQKQVNAYTCLSRLWRGCTEFLVTENYWLKIALSVFVWRRKTDKKISQKGNAAPNCPLLFTTLVLPVTVWCEAAFRSDPEMGALWNHVFKWLKFQEQCSTPWSINKIAKFFTLWIFHTCTVIATLVKWCL